MIIPLPSLDLRAQSRARSAANVCALWGEISRHAIRVFSFSQGDYALIAESPEDVSRSQCFDHALRWPSTEYDLVADVAGFIQNFLRSSPTACCIAEVGQAKAELAVWDWGPKPRYLIDSRHPTPEYYYFLVSGDADDLPAVQEVARKCREQWSIMACAESTRLASEGTDVIDVLVEVVSTVRHLIISACDGDAAIVWTPKSCVDSLQSIEPTDAMDSRQRLA